MFIVVEGIDGSGKTTLAETLSAYLANKGFTCITFRNPGGTVVGEKLRTILKDANIPMSPDAQTLAFGAAQVEMAYAIRSRLDLGNVVICDRWVYSQGAYQGVAGSSLELLATVADTTERIAKPDVALYLHVSPEEALSRCYSRNVDLSKDRAESQGIEYRAKLINVYKCYVANKLMTQIDTTEKTLKQVADEAIKILENQCPHFPS